eukprot:scaffold82968_cov71-Phaeocystis_antarctica.AAC.1
MPSQIVDTTICRVQGQALRVAGEWVAPHNPTPPRRARCAVREACGMRHAACGVRRAAARTPAPCRRAARPSARAAGSLEAPRAPWTRPAGRGRAARGRAPPPRRRASRRSCAAGSGRAGERG